MLLSLSLAPIRKDRLQYRKIEYPLCGNVLIDLYFVFVKTDDSFLSCGRQTCRPL
jgi:hypothetical protein